VGKLWLPPITKAVVYEHPPARVWRALTRAVLGLGWRRLLVRQLRRALESLATHP